MFGQLALEDHREKTDSLHRKLMIEASVDDLLPSEQLNISAKSMGFNIDAHPDAEYKGTDLLDHLEDTVTHMLNNDERDISHMTEEQLEDYIEDLGVKLETAFIEVEKGFERKSDPTW